MAALHHQSNCLLRIALILLLISCIGARATAIIVKTRDLKKVVVTEKSDAGLEKKASAENESEHEADAAIPSQLTLGMFSQASDVSNATSYLLIYKQSFYQSITIPPPDIA